MKPQERNSEAAMTLREGKGTSQARKDCARFWTKHKAKSGFSVLESFDGLDGPSGAIHLRNHEDDRLW